MSIEEPVQITSKDSLGEVQYTFTEQEDRYVMDVEITFKQYLKYTDRNFGVKFSVTTL